LSRIVGLPHTEEPPNVAFVILIIVTLFRIWPRFSYTRNLRPKLIHKILIHFVILPTYC
jgi:hypothetical protein